MKGTKKKEEKKSWKGHRRQRKHSGEAIHQSKCNCLLARKEKCHPHRHWHTFIKNQGHIQQFHHQLLGHKGCLHWLNVGGEYCWAEMTIRSLWPLTSADLPLMLRYYSIICVIHLCCFQQRVTFTGQNRTKLMQNINSQPLWCAIIIILVADRSTLCFTICRGHFQLTTVFKKKKNQQAHLHLISKQLSALTYFAKQLHVSAWLNQKNNLVKYKHSLNEAGSGKDVYSCELQDPDLHTEHLIISVWLIFSFSLCSLFTAIVNLGFKGEQRNNCIFKEKLTRRVG